MYNEILLMSIVVLVARCGVKRVRTGSLKPFLSLGAKFRPYDTKKFESVKSSSWGHCFVLFCRWTIGEYTWFTETLRRRELSFIAFGDPERLEIGEVFLGRP